ncbi:MAG: hypothetical protein AB8I08_31095, partial [Sandaracinaceae bacterium]
RRAALTERLWEARRALRRRWRDRVFERLLPRRLEYWVMAAIVLAMAALGGVVRWQTGGP